MADEITLDAPETRLERFLAAAAGMDGITLDEPETRIEKYLYKIAQGSGGVPAVEDADKGKYLHVNESTGDLEWAALGGGGGGSQPIFEGNVATVYSSQTGMNVGTFQAAVTAETITVTFNGTEYTLSGTEDEGVYGYGEIADDAPDFTNYPFYITHVEGNDSSTLFTETAGTYSLKIAEGGSGVGK